MNSNSASAEAMPAPANDPKPGTEGWIDYCEVFTEFVLGSTVNLRERFFIPKLPWRSAIAIYDPGDIPTRDLLRLVFRSDRENDFSRRLSKLLVWEGWAAQTYDGCGGGDKPSLTFTPEIRGPDLGFLGAPYADVLEEEVRKKRAQFLTVRGYILAAAQYYLVHGEQLDHETLTYFPHDRLQGPGSPRFGYGGPFFGPQGIELRFNWQSAFDEDFQKGTVTPHSIVNMGPRASMSAECRLVPLSS